MEHPLPVKSGGSQAPPWPRSSRNQDLRIYGMQYGTNLPNEPESYFSHLSCNYLSIIKLHKKYRGNNSGSFRRNACFQVLLSPEVLAKEAPLSKNWANYTHTRTPCPERLSISDRRAKFMLSCSHLALSKCLSHKPKLGHHP